MGGKITRKKKGGGNEAPETVRKFGSEGSWATLGLMVILVGTPGQGVSRSGG